MTDIPADFDLVEPSPARSLWASTLALVVKELRWRMRGRRAYVIVTVYVALLALLVFSFYQLMVDSATTQFAADGSRIRTDAVSGLVSSAIGEGLFGVLLVLQTLLTLLLAPALTSGAVSMEREKQTLELLITTPVSTLGMVVGKLVSSLAYVFLLILASIPLMSLVFAFGGIAPEDVVRAYILLFVIAFSMGSVGLFMSALLKRTQLATALSYVFVFVITVVSFVIHTYLTVTSQVFDDTSINGQPPVIRTPPEFLMLLNPLAADVDLACTAIPDSFYATCSYTSRITGQTYDSANPPRDAFWPRSALALLVLGVVLTLATTQVIAPSRRFRRHATGVAPPAGPADEVPEPAVADAPPVDTQRVEPA